MRYDENKKTVQCYFMRESGMYPVKNKKQKARIDKKQTYILIISETLSILFLTSEMLLKDRPNQYKQRTPHYFSQSSVE